MVDDSVVVRRVLGMTLRQLPEFLHADIQEAGNGVLAVRKLEESRYDLVLSDIRMPGLDGLGFVREVRAPSGIVEFEPAEMVVRVRAGTTVAKLPWTLTTPASSTPPRAICSTVIPPKQ